ncbi:hypothetical protein AAVH_17056 [Aphelenchoides avenae]|nr:hypothetical protein AAVH_17056 [Aphelenchus avenae]
MSQKAFAALVLFEIGVAVVSTSALYIFWWPSVLSTTAKATLYELSCIDEGVVPHYTMAEATSLRIGGILGMYTVLVCLHYVVITFCIYKIWRKIRSSHGMNRKTSAINRQLNHVLCLQVEK